ncbi:synchronized import protein 1 [Podospora australis]|uniref:Synchronized import protein 1 n=1 Tax=Podospora australis TaxID=1536484 RepID=A0AAN7AM35_9PEZI|nr:synchronized import protein 1 [Podospora australis]
MGKARKNRVRSGRADPIAKPVKPPSDPELAKLRESKILPVLKDLQNPDAKLRTQAASAIANIVQDTKCRKLLLREQVVHIVLTETLTDNSIDSRAAGWEILKVLAQEEEADFCVHLYRLDIITAIEHAAKTILETLTATEPPFSKLLKAQQRLVWEITSSLLTLIGLLGTAREEILTSLTNNHTVLRLLFRLAATDVAPQDTYEEALTCLLTLSEDNLQLGQAITNDQETQCYEVLLKQALGTGPKSLLSCGVLHNVFQSLQWLDHSPGKDGACDAILISPLTRVLEQVSSGFDATNGDSDNASLVQVALEILASIGTDLQETLEKGNRSQPAAAKDDEEWNGIEDDVEAMDLDGDDKAVEEEDEDEEDDEDDDDDGELDEDDDDDIAGLEEDMEAVTGVDDPSDSGNLDDLPTLAELISRAVPQLVRLSQVPPISEENQAIQSHALAALSNIAWTVSSLEFSEGENANVFEAWAPAAKKIWNKVITPIVEADSADLELATQVTSLAWAVSRSLGGNVPLVNHQHQKFMALYHASKGQSAPVPEGQEQADPFQGLGVKCVGLLGSLARNPAPLEINREVGVFLITLLNSSEKDKAILPADIIEALDQLFDTYGDETAACDEVFWKDGFLQHLQNFVPKLKAMVKTIDKRVQTELRTKADEAVLNLGRFLTYKKKHAPK